MHAKNKKAAAVWTSEYVHVKKVFIAYVTPRGSTLIFSSYVG